MAAQNLVAGNVLGWFGIATGWANSMGLGDADAVFVRTLAAVKATHAKYLTHGRLWRPVTWVVPPPIMPLHDYGYMEHNPKQACPTPLVLVACWRADDGTFALVVVNHATEPVAMEVDVDLSEAGGGGGGGGGSRRIVRVTKTVPALSASVDPVG